ncbi:hypothetical protein BvCmsKKP036_04961 [Escherichia coli]|nr:hypothetical protein BvCmsKKP036_04961 [Escherichia coli]
MSADVRIAGRQPALRRQGERRGIAGRGDAHCKQSLQEHVVHKQLIPLRHKQRRGVAVLRVNHRDTVRLQQNIAQGLAISILNPRTYTGNIRNAVFRFLHLQHVQRSQVVICVCLHPLYLLYGGTLVFQGFTDRLCDFIAGFCDGGLHLCHLIIKLAVINQLPHPLCQMCLPDFSSEKVQIPFRIIARPATGFHKRRFPHQVDAAHIKPEILPRLNVRAGDTPLAAGTQITGRGFHLCRVRDAFF